MFLDLQFIWGIFALFKQLSEREDSKQSGREKGVGWGKDHEAGMEPGSPDAQPRHMSENCPWGYLLRLSFILNYSVLCFLSF